MEAAEEEVSLLSNEHRIIECLTLKPSQINLPLYDLQSDNVGKLTPPNASASAFTN